MSGATLRLYVPAVLDALSRARRLGAYTHVELDSSIEIPSEYLDRRVRDGLARELAHAIVSNMCDELSPVAVEGFKSAAGSTGFRSVFKFEAEVVVMRRADYETILRALPDILHQASRAMDAEVDIFTDDASKVIENGGRP